jgi:hypothetical protein
MSEPFAAASFAAASASSHETPSRFATLWIMRRRRGRRSLRSPRIPQNRRARSVGSFRGPFTAGAGSRSARRRAAFWRFQREAIRRTEILSDVTTTEPIGAVNLLSSRYRNLRYGCHHLRLSPKRRKQPLGAGFRQRARGTFLSSLGSVMLFVAFGYAQTTPLLLLMVESASF